MKYFDVITIGSATRDVYLRSRGIKVVRDDAFTTGEAECFALGSKIEVDKIVFETGGGGTNTAVSFSRQGLRTAFIGKIGASDARGQEIIKALAAEKVDTAYVQVDRKRMTAYSVLLLTPRGERTALVYRGASAHFKSADLPENGYRTKWFYISSLGGELSILRKIWLIAQRHNIKIAWNPGQNELALGLLKLKPLLKNVDLFSVNQEEAAQLCRRTRDQDVQAFNELRRIVPGLTVVTQGTEGSLAGNPRQAWHCDTRRIKVIDTTGAGDAFCSGLLGGIIRWGKIPVALQFGTFNAESVIQHLGAKQGLLRRTSNVRLGLKVTILK